MRLFLMILMFAITFNGFSAVAHALTEESSHITSGLIVLDDHQAKQNVLGDQEKSDAKCSDCIHCGSAHIFTLSEYSFSFANDGKIEVPVIAETYLKSYPSSLFRPPIALI